jgi:CHASE2 domain-containing sensor protein
MLKQLFTLSALLMLVSIGLLIYGIVADRPMIPIAMPLLVVGIALGTVANAQNAKNKQK